MLLVDDHEADVGERREDGQPRPDDDRHRSRPDPPPFVGSLAITKARMDERDVRVEVGSQPVDERRRERDLGDEHEHRPAGFDDAGRPVLVLVPEIALATPLVDRLGRP